MMMHEISVKKSFKMFDFGLQTVYDAVKYNNRAEFYVEWKIVIHEN